MNPRLSEDLEVIQHFETFEGMVYRLVKTKRNSYQIRRNHGILFATMDIKKAQDKFTMIYDMLKKDSQISI